ncbi:MAG: agmatine deiminase family protein [Bacteroidota bacterium]
MRSRYFQLLLLLVLATSASAQTVNGLPRWTTPAERALIPEYRATRATATNGITTPPPHAVRTMAEWEEIDYLCVTWTQYIPTVREIVRNAVDETNVLIICSDSNQVITDLNNNNIALNRVRFLEAPFNSIWIRDYGANTTYKEEVDSLKLVEWIYNRPRPLDDAIPDAVAADLGLPLYSTVAAPYDLVHTGGNFHTDGFGTAFSSDLILDENGLGGQYNITIKGEAMIDSIMQLYMGIDRYIKMPELTFDIISHVDMHWRLLDEETLLVGEFPTGLSDGPQIEANLQYVLNNFNSVWGTPYRVVRVPMPPSANGNYAPQAYYRTYTNSVFVNKTLLVPIYRPQYDTTALRIMRESLPGYNVVGIDCNQIIAAAGALHCITRAVGVQEPLLIAHQRLRDTYDTQNDYRVDAWIKHISGIDSATLWWTTDTTQGYQASPMALTNASTDTWTGFIPAQSVGSQIFYYVEAKAISGKRQVRPLPAPASYWDFSVLTTVASDPVQNETWRLDPVFPNPARAITCIPVQSPFNSSGKIRLRDGMGREIQVIHEGPIPAGTSRYFFFADQLAAGFYLVELEGELGRSVQKVLVE